MNGAYFPVTLTRADDNNTPITVNVSKIATIEPRIEYKEDERGTDEQTPETVGSSILLDFGIAFDVMETPERITEIIGEEVPRIVIKDIIGR